MTAREHLEFLKFQADQKYAIEKRLLVRRIEDKYERLMRLGFHTPSSRAAYYEQLQAAKEQELLKALERLRGDVEAEFFGTRGLAGLEARLPSAPNILLLPPNTTPSIVSKSSIKNDETSNK